MVRYQAIINTPGYVSEQDEVPVFDTPQQAWEWLADERKRAEDQFDDWGPADGSYTHTYRELSNMDGTGTVYGDTPGYHGDHDLYVAYSVTEVEDGGEDD